MQAALITIAQFLSSLTSGSLPAPENRVIGTAGIEAVYSGMAGTIIPEGGVRREWSGLAMDTARIRRKITAIEYGGLYHARLKLHRWLGFAILPLFVGSYVTGDQVLKHSNNAPDWAIKWHRPLATATATVFTVNTITGLWNLWDSRRDPASRTKRYVHSLLLLAADAGFTYSGIVLAKEAKNSESKRRQHRNIALISMGVSVTGGGMMLLFK